MDNLWYLALAYAVIWAGLFAYLASLARQGGSIRQEMELLRDLVDRSGIEPEMELREGIGLDEPAARSPSAGQVRDGWPVLEH